MTERLDLDSGLLAAVAAAALGLAACGRSDDGRTAGQRVDSAIAKLEQTAERAKSEIAEHAPEVKREMKEAAGVAKAVATDAAITAAVNAALMRDTELRALRIDVETTDGRVSLRGPAPNAAARDRATKLASEVKGVRNVDNELVVAASS